MLGMLNACHADVNARDLEGHTPLHHAAFLNFDTKNIKWLIALGGDPRALNDDGLPPAHLVAIGHMGIEPWEEIFDKDGRRWHEVVTSVGQLGRSQSRMA